ncbi:Non-reducing polyketide synthase trt4 [Aspergillus terreus]
MSDPMNFLVVPITVLRHLVEFHEFKEAKNHYEINDIQGFCVGYLAAVAACWETDQTEFPKAVATMLRIAVCIGAVVDLDELEKQRATSMAVRWKTSADYKLLTALLSRYPGVTCVTDESAATVTIWESQAAALVKELESNGDVTTNASPLTAGYVNGTGPAATATTVPIAVTGMACRYPQADSMEELWKILEQGHCTVSPMPKNRFKLDELQREPKGPFWGNFLSRPDTFDHRFFKISAREAESMDPQQRLLLQVAYEAIESAGYCGLRASQLPQDVGCYVGVGTEDYSENVASRNATAFSATGTLQAFNSGRVSHYFGWTGPSVTIDTACSSAAVAIHLACQALQTNDCSMAVAGGVNVMTDPRWSQNLAAASFLSPTGASKAFDADANGYCRGEGAGLVVLRPLEAALRDGDPIHAVITGTSVNQGANCSPITVPDSNSQTTLYLKALSISGIKPDVVTYVEAHGTGTQVGDPIEFQSIRKTFAVPHRTERLYVGSIKDNIGHTETSSGVAGMLKTILMLQKRRIPKQANFTRLNPMITLQKEDQIFIPVESTDWKAEKRVAMVTNYGAAGSNAAIVLQEPTCTSRTPISGYREYLPSVIPVFVAARTEESIREYCKALQTAFLEAPQVNNVEVQDIAFNLARKQNRDMEYSVAFTTASGNDAELRERLEDIVSGRTRIEKKCQAAHPVVLCFGGQTGNTASISQNLVQSSELLRFHLYATAKAWLDSGLRVDRMIGHSFGQLTAVCVAGGLSLLDAMRLISSRAQLIRSEWKSDTGLMLSVRGEKETVQALLDAVSNAADIACVNGPESFVVAGDEATIHKMENIAVERGMKLRMQRLKNTHAFHSKLVDSILPGLTKIASTLNYRPLRIPVEPCSELADDWSLPTGDKIVQHSRKAVYFHNAIRRTISHMDSPCIWLEAGSASPIIRMVRRAVDASPSPRDHVYCPIDLSGPQAEENFAKVFSSLWSKGVQVQFWPFHGSQTGYRWINLPPYQFAKTSHWIDYDPNAFYSDPSKREAGRTDEPSLVKLLNNDGNVYLFGVNVNDPLFRMCTAGHAVVDQNLCPASLYFELVVRGAVAVLPLENDPTMYHIAGLDISAPLVLDMPGSVFLELTQRGSGPGQFTFVLFTRDGNQDSVAHATGKISISSEANDSGISSRFGSLRRLVNPSRWGFIATSPSSSGLKRSTVYQAFRRVVNYADYYRGVEEVYAVGHEATGRVLLPSSPTNKASCDPILIDNFIQVAGIHVNCLSETLDEEVFVCSSVGDVIIGELFVRRDPGVSVPWIVYSSSERESMKKSLCDIFVVDEATGSLALCILSATFTCVSIQSLKRTLTRLNNKALASTGVDVVVPAVAVAPAAPAASAAMPDSSRSEDGLRVVQAMLSELLGISAGEIPASAALGDVGVDSLMSTEVLSEINKRFKVVITNSELTAIADVSGLVQRIFPGGSVAHVETHSQPPDKIGITTGDRMPPPRVPPPTVIQEQSLPGFVDKARELFAASRTSNEYRQKTQFLGFCDSVFPQQMELVTVYVVAALKALNVDLQSLRFGQAVPSVEVLPQHGKVMNQLFAVLEYSGLVERRGTGMIRGHRAVNKSTATILHKKILSEHPQHASEHKLLHTTGSRLADCLIGAADPLSLLFQDAQARALMQDVYSNAPMFKSATMHLAQFLKDLLGQRCFQRRISILEIGAGTGGTTDYILKQLSSVAGLTFEYTFTDISSSLVTLARKRFKTYHFMHYATLDIEQDPAPELQGQYDIIISSNCIHATRSLATSCSNIQKLLRPQGILCLIELTRNLFWFDLVFGLLEGWWLFNDGRSHALAHERLWDQTLRQAGFNWVDWTDNDSEESKILRMIVASPSQPVLCSPGEAKSNAVAEETLVYSRKDGLELCADIYYPHGLDGEDRKRPVAILIHGGGHIMLSRKDVRPMQVKMLLDMGFLPVSIDYRLCPEVPLLEGPMVDACDALAWARHELPQLQLKRPDIRPDGGNVVAVGWSSGGHLAMTLAWTAPARSVRAPEAILSFYSPTDYTDPFWTKPNFPYQESVCMSDVPTSDPLLALHDTAITSYNPAPGKGALGGWMSPSDPRSRIALHMNWTGQTLPVLFYGCKYKSLAAAAKGDEVLLPAPHMSEVEKACPLSQVRAGRYKTPTFLIHGTLDDLIPVQQAQRIHQQMLVCGVESVLRIVSDGLHLFDIIPHLKENKDASQAVLDGYEFLRRHVGI